MTTVRERPVETKQAFSVVGKRLQRVDGADKSIGKTMFAADMTMPGMVHAKLVRSPHAHAMITKLDTTEAKAFPGVYRVLTADDLPIKDRDSATRSRNPLAWKEVVFSGQPVVAVLAGDEDVAETAADLVKIDLQRAAPHPRSRGSDSPWRPADSGWLPRGGPL